MDYGGLSSNRKNISLFDAPQRCVHDLSDRVPVLQYMVLQGVKSGGNDLESYSHSKPGTYT